LKLCCPQQFDNQIDDVQCFKLMWLTLRCLCRCQVTIFIKDDYEI